MEGATTLSLFTIGITALSINVLITIILSITRGIIAILRIMKLSIMTLSYTTLRIL
jgi:hypothetical protein